MRKIVFTGGPSGGKTSLVDLLEHEYGRRCAVVPEAATILYRGGFPRKNDAEVRRCVQRAIYYVQQELELLMEKTSGAKVLLLDRGSMDGLAYWPAGRQQYLRSLKSNPAREYARYDLVLHLRTPEGDGYRLGGVRTESRREALDIDRRILAAWSGHPRRYIIESTPDFLTKTMRVLEILKKEVPEVFGRR